MEGTYTNRIRKGQEGFSLLELMIVVAIMLIVAAYAVPMWTTSRRLASIRGSETSYAGLLQLARTRAVNDDRYYSVYIKTATTTTPQMAYVDIYPQNVNGTSGNGPTEILLQVRRRIPWSRSRPRRFRSWQGQLRTRQIYSRSLQFLRTAIIKNTAPTWGPDGLPCTPITSAGGTGLVCSSAGGPIAYVAFFQSATNNEWDAVTVSPAAGSNLVLHRNRVGSVQSVTGDQMQTIKRRYRERRAADQVLP